MNSKILNLLPFTLIVTALLVSMYLVFNTDSLVVASETDNEVTKVASGASCSAAENVLSAVEDNEIHFVGCGGLF